MNGFVLGNGKSRTGIPIETLKKYGLIIGCNALYRDFTPDYLCSVDPHMIREIVLETKFSSCPIVISNRFDTKPYFDQGSKIIVHAIERDLFTGQFAADFAVSLGCNPIFLLGCDSTYIKNGEIQSVYAYSKNYDSFPTDVDPAILTWDQEMQENFRYIFSKHPTVKFYQVGCNSLEKYVETLDSQELLAMV